MQKLKNVCYLKKFFQKCIVFCVECDIIQSNETNTHCCCAIANTLNKCIMKMLKKYFVEIENCELNAHHIFVINSMLNENELKNQIEKMYKNNYIDDFIVNVKNYNYLTKIIIDTLNLKNDCVAKNVFFSFF